MTYVYRERKNEKSEIRDSLGNHVKSSEYFMERSETKTTKRKNTAYLYNNYTIPSFKTSWYQHEPFK